MRHAPISAACAAALALSAPALAQQYPAKPVRVVIPWPAGGNTDVAGRVVVQRLAESTGQQFIVDNRGGANGVIGSELAARAQPDGYTLLLDGLTTHAINATYFPKLPFSTERDFEIVAKMGAVMHILVVHPAFPAHSARELVAIAKARPGEVAFASFGAGTTSHFAGELLASLTGIRMLHVPYKGGGLAMTDVVAGQVPVYFPGTPIALPNVKAGRIRALAVTGAQRSVHLPEAPTLGEALKLPGYEVSTMWGLLAPRGTPREVVNRLNREVAGALQHPDTRARLAVLGVEMPEPQPPEQTAAWYRAEAARWARIVNDSGVKGQF